MKSQRLFTVVAYRTFLLLCAYAAGCVSNPVVPPATGQNAAPHGAIVVNEGLFGHDNSTLTVYDPVGGGMIQDFYAQKNPGLRLGDTGNDIVVWGGRAY